MNKTIRYAFVTCVMCAAPSLPDSDEMCIVVCRNQVLFPPMTNLEFIGMPRLETHCGRQALVVTIRANVSLKNQTREELEGKRKAVFLPSLENVRQETEREIDALMNLSWPAFYDEESWARTGAGE